MGSWSFKKRIKIIPGIRLNLSRSGISTSIGISGANLTFGNKGTYLNTGIPGTGIYKRQKIFNTEQPETINNEEPPIINIKKEDTIFSIEPEKITSQDMQGIKDSIIDAYNQREQLQKDIKKVQTDLVLSKILIVIIHILIFGFFSKKLKNQLISNIENQKNAINQLEKEKNNSYIKLDIEFDEEMKTAYNLVLDNFKKLINSQKIWDITRSENQNRVTTRSAASTAIVRTEVKFDFQNLEDIQYQNKALYFKNANGADLYFYPNFIVMKNKNDFGVIGLNELDFDFSETSFVEQEAVPSDSKIIDTTWLKVNKNGTPDKRFKDNKEIPMVRYGTITLNTETGVNEEYQFSNYESCEEFSNNFCEYINIIKESKII